MVVYGHGASACANMFLGGITRKFAALPAKHVEQCEHLDGFNAFIQCLVTTWDEVGTVAPLTPSNEKVTVKSWNQEQ